ncbi:MAG: type II toxin-antitoxin system RelE/ParE family toxin [Oscillospiraceae bacterium]|jgi:hypothetical protein|nr:type II toxin-antitoxin system RelE/ParE family toxin [Oscillospiraceae bacterium]
MTKQSYIVKFVKGANDKMETHIEFLARVSLPAAEKLYSDFEETILFLQKIPASCPVYDLDSTIDAEIRYKLFGKRYRMVFEIVDQTVYVYDIQDCRQDTDKNLI